ncbi:NAD(P)/FAD-dependent oxidoreductase [Mycobacterium conspicuum]|jgi:isorenieratene synthase|uniref:Dehydrogenase n=1 Tax=Mycobacterium conspicuum TaxID=44010 RepID=A0A1X1TGW7_9MYCO|nr:NAD(P)/FAD-dependent oxidoreductase [Mycobacterium conspicuum]ORV43760.1 isorenieratene synthase [Mycobacterium conspicuum]BBZ38348.1 dehydrogenase [Mycobacterium conspicuum]
MTDRRRHVHPGAPGLPGCGSLPSRPRVTVVGGGIAGLAAATGLAERGVAVDLVEAQGYLGGRVGGWTEHRDGAELAMNRGFHAFFRQYYNLRALLRRVDPQLRMLVPVDDYPLIDGAGRRDSFRGLPRTPPWNALAFALRSPTFRLGDLARIDARAAAPLAAVSVPGIYRRLDHVDADTFLKGINFPESARHLAFEVFSRSFFAEPAQLSAAELATMFHIYFLGSSEGLIFDVANANFNVALWDPLRQYLQDRGVRVHLGTPVRQVTADKAGAFRIVTESGDRFEADAVVLALDVDGLRRVIDASPGLGDDPWRTRIRQLRTAPPFVVDRLWLDRPVHRDRPAFLGTSGHQPLDNISVPERYEQEGAAWARRHGGSVVELHSYATASDWSPRQAAAQLHQLYPETAGAGVVHERVLVRSDCPLFAPGTYARRPTVTTPQPGLVLAGDAIRIDLPVALMERAATTGFSAANHLLQSWRLAGHELCTVPTRGRSALLRSLAERHGARRQ